MIRKSSICKTKAEKEARNEKTQMKKKKWGSRMAVVFESFYAHSRRVVVQHLVHLGILQVSALK